MTAVLVTGAAGTLGRRVVPALREALGEESRITALDRVPSASGGAATEIEVDLGLADLKPLFEGIDVVVHLASSFDVAHEGLDSAQPDLEIVRRVLDAAGDASVGKVVMLSSAMVYGAWPNNPIPITEETALRPNPDFSFAVAKAETERLVAEWRTAHPGAAAVILRPTTAVARGESSWVSRALRAAANINVGDEDPPVQFLHLDDLASAVAHAALHDLDGPYNVAPDHSVGSDQVRELDGRTPRLRLREDSASRLTAWGWRWRLTPTPPGIVTYTRQPWVVANDRLRATGWRPEWSNEQAYVEGYQARPWAMMNSRRRQQLALGGAVLAIVAVGAAITVAVVKVRRRKLLR